MKSIVITGSTRGIGFGLADAFLALGCQVTVSGRAQASVDRAVADLAARHGEAGRVAGFPCNVTRLEELQALWDAARARFGQQPAARVEQQGAHALGTAVNSEQIFRGHL